MVETRRTPGRSSGRSFDKSDSSIGACISPSAEVHPVRSLDGGPHKTHPNALTTTLPTLSPPPQPQAHRFIIQPEHSWRRPPILASDARPNVRAEKPTPTQRREVAALPNWRLKRVIDFMETHADQPITLGDLAHIAGLSRMHFAAQFRKATGLRPHAYLLRRRIEKAKTILATSSSAIAEVALTVGFSSQSHFTGVFKRLTGLTPLSWRELSRA